MSHSRANRPPRVHARAWISLFTLVLLAGCKVNHDGAGPSPARADSPDAVTDPTSNGAMAPGDGALAPGRGDAAAPAGARPLGAACQKSDQCDSGFCADGFCCNVACAGACFSCSQRGSEGECLPQPAGAPDGHGFCRKDAPESCGQSGQCNGQGGCAKYGAGSPCGGATCSGSHTAVPAAECNGDGTCVKGVALECAPFACNGNSCRFTCTSDAQCVAPAVCTNGSCGKRGKGQTCTTAGDCASGFCADGVCCESACTGRCQFCANPDARGTCVPVRADVPDPRVALGIKDLALICVDAGTAACGNDGRCDGKGACQNYKNGTVCRPESCDSTSNTEIGVGACLNGACNVPAARSCAPFRGCTGARCVGQCTSDPQCVAGNVCTNGSCGKRPQGALCTRDLDCAAPGICAQGRCCAGACSGPCLSCNLAGSAGVCTPVPPGGADPTGSCHDDACNNGCDGSGGCRREAPGTSCQAATCSGTTLTRHTCSDAGSCTPSTEACPAGQLCMGDHCAPAAKKPPGETCLGNDECQSGACVAGHCCGSACAGPCHECTLATSWMCSNLSDGSDCGGGSTCMGGSCGKKGAGATCHADNECQSGSCVGNACCGNACTAGACRTCSADTQWMCKDAPNDAACGVGGLLVCRDGACVPRCPLGQITCGGVCVNLRNDEQNCGGCGNACTAPTPVCRQGTCMARPGPGPDPLPQTP